MRKICLLSILFITFSLVSCFGTKSEKAIDTQQKENSINSVDSSSSEEESNLSGNELLTGTPEEYGVDGKVLSELDSYISQNLKSFHSFLLLKNGHVIFEKYYSGYDKQSLNNIKSCTKSIMSILVGIAINEKYISDTSAKISTFYPQYFKNNKDGNKDLLEVKHLLTMTTAFEWIDNSAQMDQWWNGKDLIENAINLPMEQKPGEVFNYCSPATHLLSDIVSCSSGMSTLEFAYKYLFEPLGIKEVRWDSDGNGINYGFGEMYLTTGDMAKIGYLYLKNGIWNDKEIVNSDWVRISTDFQIETGSTIGNYGYCWWVKYFGKHKVYFAAGWGGQHIFVIPDSDMVVVTTQDWNSSDPSAQHRSPFLLMEDYIIPLIDE